LIVEEEFPPVESVLDSESVPVPVPDPEPDPEPEDELEELTDGVELPPPPPPQEARIKKVVINNNDPYLFIISPNLIFILLINLHFTRFFNNILNFN
jgi:hypothetical protein|tara:strand:- start:365 stop:655 length:291 start_codon:yes stop_codon:yes gene_type:complete